MSYHRSTNYLTKLDLEFTIARHLDCDEIRVYVTIFKYQLALVWIRPYPFKKENHMTIIDLKSVDNKLVIKHKNADKFLQSIVEIQDDILEILNNYVESCCLCCR